VESEKTTEKYLRQHIRNLGGQVVKMRPIEKGWPDRLCILPGGIIFFVELKSEGKKPDSTQRYVHAELFKLGCEVYVADTKAKVDSIIKHYLKLEGS